MPEEQAKLEEQIKTLRKEMDEVLRQRREAGSLLDMEERLSAIEDSKQDAFSWDSSTPDTSRSGDLMDVRKMPKTVEEELRVIPFDIEFGKPTANVTTDVATVTMQPCAEDGTSFANAATVTVYIANDRQTQDTSGRGWTTTTILSFIRFAPFVAGTPNIEGVLIGEDIVQAPDPPVSPEGDDIWIELSGTYNHIGPQEGGNAYAPIDVSGEETLCSPLPVFDDEGHLLGWMGLSGGVYDPVAWYSPWGYSAPSLPLDGTR